MSGSSQEPRFARASGERSIAVGGDAVNSFLVTGDNNTFFFGRYERLVDAYLDPRPLYRELSLDAFTGRQWLVAAMDRFMATHDKGYLILEADAGMGKSTFLAWLARERGFVHHFVRLMTDPQDVSVAVKNLSAQLIRAWDVESHAVGGVLPPSAARPEFLKEVIAEAAANRDRLRPGEPVVLVVDGLNETVAPAGHNPLGLPASLPAGVYVLASQRPVQVPLVLDVPRGVVVIDAKGEENMRDVGEYLERVVQRPDIAPKLRAAGVSDPEFIDTLLAKSGGVWIYLHYVVPEIARGTRDPRQLADLPAGLWHYYAQFWHGWQTAHPQQWFDLHLPVLAALAAAAEPVTGDLLCEFAGVDRVLEVEELLDNHWRPFVQVEEGAFVVRYSAYHDSLREFMAGRIGSTADFTAAERSLGRRLARATTQAHSAIADRYLHAWGGLAAGLPQLRYGAPTDTAADMDDGYGMRHLASQLIGAERQQDLHTLMALSWQDGTATDDRPAPAHNAWYVVHRDRGDLAGYRADVMAAWRQAHAGLKSVVGPDWCLEMRYAMCVGSLNSLAASAPPGLWAMLVRRGLATQAEALHHVRQIPTAEERAQALTDLLDTTDLAGREDLLREALAVVRTVPDEFWRVGELARLLPFVPEQLHPELQMIARTMRDPYYRVVALRVLGTAEDGLGLTSVPSGAGFEPDPESESGLAASVLFLREYRHRQEYAVSRLREAGIVDLQQSAVLSVTDATDSTERYWRSQVLTTAAADISSDTGRFATAARSLAERIGDRRETAAAWSALGSCLARAEGDSAMRLAKLEGLSDPLHRVFAVVHFTASRPEPLSGVQGVLAHALEEIDDPQLRAWILTEVASPLAVLAGDDPSAMDAFLSLLPDAGLRADVRLAVAAACTGPDAADRWTGALLESLGEVAEEDRRAGLLAGVAPLLRHGLITNALTAAQSLRDQESRAAALSALSGRCAQLAEVDTALCLLPSLNGSWKAEALRAIATSMVESGDTAAGCRWARELPHPPWTAEILVLAAHRLPAGPAEEILNEAEGLLAGLDSASLSTAMTRMAAQAPAAHRSRFFDRAIATAQGLDDPYERSVAMAGIVEAFASCGCYEDALAASAEVLDDYWRFTSLVTVASGAPDVVRSVLAHATVLPDGLRARVQSACLRRLVAQLPVPAPMDAVAEVHAGLDQVLASLATRPRSELMSAMADLLPAIEMLAGPAGADRVADDLFTALGWWP
ncbi:hypothetical protein [Streptomyces mirabilis]|uniref:hypothetical protein n=1 Tax=Streptomyces mirabilis TaxID=68239 RepID=UPI003658CB83